MSNTPSPENLDLDKLNEGERGALEATLNRSSIAWPMALICAALSGIALFLVVRSGIFGSSESWMLVLKILGFVALGYWARGWSRVAALGLLGWHIWMNHQYLQAESFQLKLHFWLPALVFGWALFQAVVRASLLKEIATTGNPEG